VRHRAARGEAGDLAAARRWAALPDHAHAFVRLVGAAFADLEATARVELVAEDTAPSG
jgi:hypothetical protein